MDKILNFIGGALCEPDSGAYIETVEPATGKAYALVPDSDETDVQRAVEAAKAAFPGWRDMGADKRAVILNKWADLVDRDRAAFIAAESRDNGKPVSLAGAVDIPRGAANLRAFAAAAPDFCARHPFKSENPKAEGYILHQPVGVVATISPWNLPLLLFTWKFAPALAVGNCVVAKPSEITPMTAFMLSALANEAGIPPGVFNVVHGTGPRTGSALVGNKEIKRLSFTGSTVTGRAIEAAFKAPVTLEMGGKNPTIIFDDADFDAAVEGAKMAAFANQGQICLCGSRIYVQEGIYEKFRDALVAAIKAIKIGDPMDPATQHGAMVSEAHMNKVLGCIDLAKEEGGTILTGGGRVRLPGRCADGYFIAPTLIEGLGNSCRTNQEEIFGPVATIMPFKTEEDAIRLANESQYGLAGSVWSLDPERARRVADRLELGMVWINVWNLRVLDTPFGGVKNSGNGHREGVPGALIFFTDEKAVCTPSLS